MNSQNVFGGAYRGKQVLVTGHTGFKGGWLSLWLRDLGANVHGFALPPAPGPGFHSVISQGTFASEVFADIRNAETLQSALGRIRPHYIFHLAAQPLVRHSYSSPVATIETNVLGTANLLEAVRRLGLSSDILVVTSDKCYENRDWDHGYRESDALGGHDVYSASKAACELIVGAWRRSFFETSPKLGKVATARAGNVIGGGDFAADRIVPDCVQALSLRNPVRVRNPEATRPWQHVLDCLSGYLWYAAVLASPARDSTLSPSLNFGPPIRDNRDVRSLVNEFLRHWPGEWVDASDPTGPHEAHRLHLATDQAAAQLGWQPTWNFEEAVKTTAVWYRQFHEREGRGMKAVSRRQIASFVRSGRNQKQPWAVTQSLTPR